MKQTTEESQQLFNKKILENIGKKFLRRKETIAVAESVTAGLLQYGLSNIPDAASFYHGGITAYNLGQKYRHLQVEPLHAAAVNCVSQKVADEMALHVCERFGSHWGMGITGYASPVPASGNKLFAYYAIVRKSKIIARGKITAQKIDPPLLQLKYAQHVFSLLSKLV
ncbi:MAG TPA: CinA family protein [Chitinophagaceae bacterium]|nr:CinA family protein [Chitinophagaceae bacterium]